VDIKNKIGNNFSVLVFKLMGNLIFNLLCKVVIKEKLFQIICVINAKIEDRQQKEIS
jgi:hypothetical protein